MKAQGQGRGIALSIHKLGTRRVWVGSRRVGRAVPGSLCYWEVTLAALRGFRSLSRGVRC